MIPTTADGVVLAPIVMNIKPNPTWKKPAKNPKNISCKEISILPATKYPIIIATIPAINCKGTISTLGYFLTIIIRTAKDIGIIKAIKFPSIWPDVKESPSISVMPDIASIIDANVILEIVSLRNIYPKIARNNVWVWIIKFAFATVVLYIANTYPKNPQPKIIPPTSPGIPELTIDLKNCFL